MNCDRSLNGPRLGLLCLGLALGPLASAQTAKIVGDLERVVIPMNHSTGHLQLDVMIDGKGPFLFQLDTYATIDACVDDDFAEQMGFKKTGTVQNSDGVTIRTKDLVRIDSLQLGEARFSDLRTLVDDYDWVGEGGRKIHGLLGFALFRELLLTIDYPNDRIVLERGRLSKKDPHTLAMDLSGGGPDIYLELGGKRTLFGIDTGMGMPMIMSLKHAKSLGLSDKLKKAGPSSTVYSTVKLFKAQLHETLDLAGNELVEPVIFFTEKQFKPLLGKGVLWPYALTFDQGSKRVRIAVPKKEQVQKG